MKRNYGALAVLIAGAVGTGLGVVGSKLAEKNLRKLRLLYGQFRGLMSWSDAVDDELSELRERVNTLSDDEDDIMLHLHEDDDDDDCDFSEFRCPPWPSMFEHSLEFAPLSERVKSAKHMLMDETSFDHLEHFLQCAKADSAKITLINNSTLADDVVAPKEKKPRKKKADKTPIAPGDEAPPTSGDPVSPEND